MPFAESVQNLVFQISSYRQSGVCSSSSAVGRGWGWLCSNHCAGWWLLAQKRASKVPRVAPLGGKMKAEDVAELMCNDRVSIELFSCYLGRSSVTCCFHIVLYWFLNLFLCPVVFSSPEELWDCLQDVWSEWWWRGGSGGVWPGKTRNKHIKGGTRVKEPAHTLGLCFNIYSSSWLH